MQYYVDEVFLMGNFNIMTQNRQCDTYESKDPNNGLDIFGGLTNM